MNLYLLVFLFYSLFNSLLFADAINFESKLNQKYKIYTKQSTQAYPNVKLNYFGIPLKDIIKEARCESWEIKSNDGFVTIIDNELINNCEQEAACPVLLYDKYGNWPKKSTYGGYVGKYYLAWFGKNNRKISREMWVWGVDKISCYENRRICDSRLENKTRKGCELFKRNCFGCHSIFKNETNRIAPNLLYPMSPIEYFSSIKILKMYIRDPQKIRSFENDRMLGFSEKELSDTDIELIINYMQYLNKNRTNN